MIIIRFLSTAVIIIWLLRIIFIIRIRIVSAITRIIIWFLIYLISSAEIIIWLLMIIFIIKRIIIHLKRNSNHYTMFLNHIFFNFGILGSILSNLINAITFGIFLCPTPFFFLFWLTVNFSYLFTFQI